MTTNKYDGMTWNGRRWLAEDDSTGEMVPQKVTLWQRSPVLDRILLVILALVAIGGAAWANMAWDNLPKF